MLALHIFRTVNSETFSLGLVQSWPNLNCTFLIRRKVATVQIKVKLFSSKYLWSPCDEIYRCSPF